MTAWKTYFVSGHIDLTKEEFAERYAPRLREAAEAGSSFVVGDAHGCDFMAQRFLREECGLVPSSGRVTVYHMLERPRHSYGSGYGSNDPNLPKETWQGKRGGYPLKGGFVSDEDRDAAMTAASDEDVAWVRPEKAKRNSGTAKNLQRRVENERELRRSERRQWPRFRVDVDYVENAYVSVEPIASDAAHPELAVPLPPELYERYHNASAQFYRAAKDLHEVEAEVRAWENAQDSDPV